MLCSKGLALKDVEVFVGLFQSLPPWVLLFVPARLVGTSVGFDNLNTY